MFNPSSLRFSQKAVIEGKGEKKLLHDVKRQHDSPHKPYHRANRTSLNKGGTVFRTVQSVRPGGRTGRTAAGSPSFFETMDGLWKVRLGPDALRGPVGPYGIFLFLETSS